MSHNFTDAILAALVEEVLEDNKGKTNKELATKLTRRLRGKDGKKLVISKQGE
jgi:hypothetical protein